MMFRGAYAFMSNMYACEIPCVIRGQHYTFHNAEALYQAMECPERASEFEPLDGPAAKRLGKRVPIRPDWEKIKLQVMARVVHAKFGKNPALAEKLMATGDIDIVETNSWRDTYWGTYKGAGSNHLGKILMAERAALASQQKQSQPTAGKTA